MRRLAPRTPPFLKSPGLNPGAFTRGGYGGTEQGHGGRVWPQYAVGGRHASFLTATRRPYWPMRCREIGVR